MSETRRRLRWLEGVAFAGIPCPVGRGYPLSADRLQNLQFAVLTEGPACPTPAWLVKLNAEAAEAAEAHAAILTALREVPRD
jgi:hypothetical protein